MAINREPNGYMDGRFQKGSIPWNKGKGKGKKPYIPTGNPVGRPKGLISWNKGMKGLYSLKHDGQFKKGCTAWNKGKPYLRKEDHPNWITDRSQLIQSEHKHLDGRYREWMFSVKNRDGWKCRINNSDCNGRLESHHILNWKDYPELRYDINNGITLCHAHHPLGRENEAKWSRFFQELVAEKQ